MCLPWQSVRLCSVASGRRFASAQSILDASCFEVADGLASDKGICASRVDLWRHLRDNAEFYVRHQDQWNLAMALGPRCPILGLMHDEFGCMIQSKLIRAEGGASSGGGKLILALPKKQVETAIIVKAGRQQSSTICVSSQAGCAMACRFCDTGLVRPKGGINLPAWAILEQVLHAEAWLQRELKGHGKSNIVFMGMGEPLLNYSNVLDAARLLCSSGHKITISTVGVAPRIKSLAQEAPPKVRLAVSLHAPTQSLREELVPASKSWDLEMLFAAVNHFEEVTGSGVLIQYILIRGINDQEEHARMLTELILSRTSRCAGINLIPYNETTAGAAFNFESPSDSTCKRFRDTLRRLGAPNVTIRFSTKLGRDWSSACGQLGLDSKPDLLATKSILE